MFIVSLVSYKGGTGKTVSSLMLAGCLARRGRTVLVDGDLNRSSIEYAERGPGLPFEVIDRDEGFRRANEFDFAVIDTAARPEAKQLKAIARGCDRLIVTTSADAISMAALKPAIADLHELKAEFSILVTMIPPVGFAGQLAREAIEAEGLPVYKTMIRRFAAYQKAALAGCLVCDAPDDYAAEAWADYLALTKEILK